MYNTEPNKQYQPPISEGQSSGAKHYDHALKEEYSFNGSSGGGSMFVTDVDFKKAGIAGGIACLITMFVWYIITKETGYEFGYGAIAVGIVVGMATRIGAGDSTFDIGIMAAVFTMIAIVGGRYFFISEQVNIVYQEDIIQAKKMVQIATTGSEEEKNKLVVRLIRAEMGQDVHPDDLDEDSYEWFDNKAIPKIKAFIASSPSDEKSKILKESDIEILDAYTILWFALGLATAFRVAYFEAED